MSDPSPSRSDRFSYAILVACIPLVLVTFLVVAGWVLWRIDRPQGASTAPPRLPRITPTATVAEMLPLAPAVSQAPVYLGDDLAAVPEVMLEAAAKATTEVWKKRKAQTAAGALHLNLFEEDGFLRNLLSTRPDLAGLPFVMGSACRTTGPRAAAFKMAADTMRVHMRSGALGVEHGKHHFDQAHLAVITQVLPAERFKDQTSLIHALAAMDHPEATQALARIAVFAPDEAVRDLAIEPLKARPAEESTKALVAGLGYPWPAVAEQAATAIAKLKRNDLIPQLEAALEAPDPRGPKAETVNGREETVAYELVRVNHMRNCMLCHAPAEQERTPDGTLVAEVPVPTQPLPDTSQGYGQSGSTLLVRIDVTYLRQDFSAMQRVTDWTVEPGHETKAPPWPEMQRFDYLLRRRVLTPDDATDLRARLAGESPYRRAAARALRDLTGRDFVARAD
jgi:hypothetical protein